MPGFLPEGPYCLFGCAKETEAVVVASAMLFPAAWLSMSGEVLSVALVWCFGSVEERRVTECSCALRCLSEIVLSGWSALGSSALR